MSTPTSEFLTSLAITTVPRCGGRPLRDLRLEHLAGAVLTSELMSQGLWGYAGDDEHPRPVRPRSLYDNKKWVADYSPRARYRGAFPEDAFYFAFCSDHTDMPLNEAIPVPRDHLWWLAAPGDTLLLSDLRTHHYTRVYYVDPDADRIYLLDSWPDRIFLKKGLNTRRVEALIEPVGHEEAVGRSFKRVSITRSEFLRVIVGIITLDTPELIEHYLAQYPAQRESFEVQLAFGLALMDAEQYVLARFAVARFQAALRLAEAARVVEQVEHAAARLYVALNAAIHYQQRSGDPLATKPFTEVLHYLSARHSEDRLLSGTLAVELCSLGNAAGASGDYTAAMRFLDIAIARFPGEEEPWRLRAKIRLLCQDHCGAFDDVTQALERNAHRIQELEERHDAWHPHDHASRSDDEARIAGLKNRRSEELEIQVVALVHLGRLKEARGAAEALIAHASDS